MRIDHQIYLLLSESRVKFIKKLGYLFGQRLIGENSYGIYFYKGIKLWLNPLNYIDIRLIFKEGHDLFVEELIESKLAAGGVFLDIGANFGLFSVMAAKKAGVKVFAFEPSMKELRRIAKNIELNELKNIWVVPYGLSDRNSTEKLFIAPYRNSGMNSSVRDFGEGVVEMPTIRMDGILNQDLIEEIRLVKVDVEGAELQVLQGFGDSLGKMTNISICVEITPDRADIRELYALMETYGYQVTTGLKLNIGQYDEVFFK